MAERALAYNPQFDISDAVKVRTNPQKENQFKLRTKHNLETALGERFNVEISQVTYQLVDNHLYNPEHDEPFIDVIRRGQHYRQKYGNPLDRQRETAEALGFECVEQILNSYDPVSSGSIDTGSSTKSQKIIVISPQGDKNSSYQHNFFDIYQKQGDKVTMTRYPSKATLSEFWQAACELDPNLPTPIKLSDAYFLSHPIQTAKSADEIVTMLQKDQSAMSKENFNKLIADCSPLICAYINGLVQNSEDQIKKTFNALLNYADSISPIKGSTSTNLAKTQTPIRVEEIIKVYGAMQARTVTTGCGLQKGFGLMVNGQWSMVSKTPFSVSEFGSNSEDHSDFPCPRCGHIITYGAGIKECPGCGLQATCG